MPYHDSDSNNMAAPGMGLLEKDTESLDMEERHASNADRFQNGLLYAANSVLQVVKPSFLSRKGDKKNSKLRRTAYLDGLRGFAAFLVYWHHHLLWAHEALGSEKILQSGYGYEGNYYFANLPGVRIFVNGGHIAVASFFVLSGYVLSMKPLLLINSGEYAKLGDNVAAALFKRWLRLYLPILATTFILLCAWHIFGIYGNFVPEPNFGAGIWKWYIDLKNYTFVFRTGGDPWLSYNPHTWSIPVEFKGSIIIYTALLAFSRCTRRARFFCEAALTYYFMYIADGAHFAMFMAGMMLCDADIAAQNDDLPSWFAIIKEFETPIVYTMFIVAMLLGGIPSYLSDVSYLRDSPGWYVASFMKPQAVFDYKWFFLFWAAIFLIISSGRIPWLKRFFETRFNLYLCRISYMLYLVHGPILWTLGDRLYAAVGFAREQHAMSIPHWVNSFPVPRIGPYALELSFFVPQIILLPVTLLAAELATTMIDGPSLRFSGWLYKQTVPAPEEGHRGAENRA
ncbi:hypothetical protein B0A50_03902 [Salinomyces thailandicus]|uniref:Acyltransferase 3 domain-containing protein n=1 Tax=Salinomyces thailandicus TaxID=706561 RepID=A0A4U0U308_9PEZI|nr:hypothetical protein B0A50_03902 [Salinomyces thailandica]